MGSTESRPTFAVGDATSAGSAANSMARFVGFVSFMTSARGLIMQSYETDTCTPSLLRCGSNDRQADLSGSQWA